MHFYKYQGTGNDFVIVDNRSNKYSTLSEKTIFTICDRRFGIGADGFMLFNNKPGYDFEMIYHNADGKKGSLCGNGGRCIVRFAKDIGMVNKASRFLASDGEHIASISEEIIGLKMKDVDGIESHADFSVLDTGSPHYIKKVDKVSTCDVVEEGRAIRNSERFKQEGINVNFVEVAGNSSLKVRTYERGVENETLSCGTGVTAAALVFYQTKEGFNSINIEAAGGVLNVSYHRNANGSYNNIWLKGPAVKVFDGDINV